MKREVKELFAKAERTKKQLDEMMAELDDSLIKLKGMTRGLPFRKRISLFPGARINLSKTPRFPLCVRPASYSEPRF